MIKLLMIPVMVVAALISSPLHATETKLHALQASGTLLVATRKGPTTFEQTTEGPRGFEYELVRMFAKHLGVRPVFILYSDIGDLLTMVGQGGVHLAAAGLTITPELRAAFRIGPVYQKITQQVVYRSGSRRPRSVKDLTGRQLEVPVGSSHESVLNRHRLRHANLKWHAGDSGTREMLRRVARGELELTIANSNEVALVKRYNPALKVAFDLKKKQSLAWLFSKHGDASLQKAARRFFKKIRADGRLAQLIDRYYGYSGRVTNVDTYWFMRHARSRLPLYLSAFHKAGKRHHIDWRLLAAVGYQESQWDAKAVSPTGVRGLMMLTRETARDLGIKDRRDPKQSIEGGARYLRQLIRRLPKSIKGPDRLWMALASYNIGFGHLLDARKLTKRFGRNPNHWAEVKKVLPLLKKKRWYKKTRYGAARGDETVDYVDSVRAWYDLVKWTSAAPQNMMADVKPLKGAAGKG